MEYQPNDTDYYRNRETNSGKISKQMRKDHDGG